MVQICDRVESARRAMEEVTGFLSAPNQAGLADNQKRLVFVALEMQGILEDAAAAPSQERARIQESLRWLQREIRIARALVLQAAGIFQGLDESVESDVTTYSPVRLGANREQPY